MRDLGCVQSPMSAYMLNLGLESLHVRMARHCENGQAVAEFLASHPKIAYVNYCGLPGDKYHALAQKYLPNGSCGVVSFGVKGGREAAANFMAHPEGGRHRDPCGRHPHLLPASRQQHPSSDERRTADCRPACSPIWSA